MPEGKLHFHQTLIFGWAVALRIIVRFENTLWIGSQVTTQIQWSKMEGCLMLQLCSAHTMPKEGGKKEKREIKTGRDRDNEVCVFVCVWERESSELGPHVDPQAENICDLPHCTVGECFLALDYHRTFNRPKTLCVKVCVHQWEINTVLWNAYFLCITSKSGFSCVSFTLPVEVHAGYIPVYLRDWSQTQE